MAGLCDLVDHSPAIAASTFGRAVEISVDRDDVVRRECSIRARERMQYREIIVRIELEKDPAFAMGVAAFASRAIQIAVRIAKYRSFGLNSTCSSLKRIQHGQRVRRIKLVYVAEVICATKSRSPVKIPVGTLNHLMRKCAIHSACEFVKNGVGLRLSHLRRDLRHRCHHRNKRGYRQGSGDYKFQIAL